MTDESAPLRPRRPFDPRRGDPRTIYDRGMQQERTALAWDRTALAMIVGGALFVRAGQPPYHAPRHLPGILMIVLGAVVLVLSFERYERRDVRLRGGGPVLQPLLVRVVGVAVVLFSAASMGLVLFGA